MNTHILHTTLSIATSVWLVTIPALAANPTGAKARLVTNSADTRGLFEDLPSETVALQVPAIRAAETATSVTNTPPLSSRSMDSLDDQQTLGAGDRVSFKVLQDQEDARSLTVTDAGQLDVPELGLVPATGKTCKQLALELKPKLEQTAYYHATVIIGIELLRPQGGRRVYVTGEVMRPGPQDIHGGQVLTVSRAITLAGGFTLYANQKVVRLIRAGPKGQPGQTVKVNVSEVFKSGRVDKDPLLQADDLIVVPERGAW